MGFPEIILCNPKPLKENINNYDNEKGDDDNNNNNDNDIAQKINDEEKKEDPKDKNDNEKNQFWPLFGGELLRQSNNGEIFKYINNIKLYETHCLLAQLFPCTRRELYSNLDFIEEDQKLNEEERNNYIYKLLCISLLDEGNFALFKYIYLTQSRFAIKYNNLYEEIIDILSKDNKYDLVEIKKNADICIKRINIELKRINENLSTIMNKNIDSEDEKENINNNIENNNEEIPSLPEKMQKNYKENEEVDEFTGFFPKHLIDTIGFVAYTLLQKENNSLLMRAQYYTTFKNMEIVRKEEKEKQEKGKDKKAKTETFNKDDNKNFENEGEKVSNDNPNKIIENKEVENEKEKVKLNKNIEEKEELIFENDEDNSDNELFDKDLNRISGDFIFDVNNIKMTEGQFIHKVFGKMRRPRKIIIINKSLKKKIKVKLGLVRYLLFTIDNEENMLKIQISDKNQTNTSKFNFYFPNLSLDYLGPFSYVDIVCIYRRNKFLDFIREHSIVMGIKIHSKREFSNDNYFKWLN
jgi:hypothetical protein